ncbi:MAG: DUF3769 domain-containing protein [Hormoscilla sp. GUM202]|nr:DUF3769 domain-containing protein [Hormoscilla sp. GUM202]
MPYPPVPPPEQPPIVYNLPPESVMEPAVRYVWLTVAPAASAKLLGPPMTVGLPIKSAAGQARQLPEVTRNDTAAQAPAAPDPLDRETGPSAPQEAIAPELQQSLIQLTADQQEYDTRRQVFTASGNVQMRFGNALLQAAKLQVNLVNRIAVAQGNVSLLTGEQLLLGERFEYNFVHGTGVISAARGSIFVPTTSEDLSGNGTTSLDATTVATGTVGEPLGADRPPENVIGTGGVSIGGDGNIPEAGGGIRRLRFEAEQIDFTPAGWKATNIRFTNDPFSPPELEVRANRATLTRLSALQDEVRTSKARLVFDQRLSVSLLRDRLLIDRRDREPAIVSFGFDDRDRGGLFVESRFKPIATDKISLSLTPQFYLQRALKEGKFNDLSIYGLKADLNMRLTSTTLLRSKAAFVGFDDVGDTARASLRVSQSIKDYTLTGEYSYRDRLFNGSLGYQTVQRSIGAVLTSPAIQLGDTGINFNYQIGYQEVKAKTDRRSSISDPFDPEENVTLNRFQTSATLNRDFILWQGEALPATAEAGLRYTPTPVVPYIQLISRIVGTTSTYSNGENQSSLKGSIGLQGQLGHFSRPWFDYTGFSLVYSQFIRNGESPFKFDRIADVRVLTAQLTQQIYGPFRLGVRTKINLDNSEGLSTDYTLEYSRRTYGMSLRYNPVLGLGAFNFRISDFSSTGSTESFSESQVRSGDGDVENRELKIEN